ncbi:N-acetylglucosamine kinase [Colwellia sp. MB3u-55]|uniref:N-acetylglucosamine kinase n=1 Tax=Colwellia sp. MB3u-55 TaxID=2759810 RepID=UPI0015F4474F|nr:BadF/BadG/BcrA/BcrD ATPase family protein [Colwellia sp. MB3u-55]MBA6251997.1 ATPase [Colwellia sp. MB3u-55]
MLSSSGNNEIFLGIDGGGSKCKAILVSNDNKILGTGIAGPANPLHGYEQAISSIAESAKLALKNAGIDESELGNIIAGVGLAGVNLPVLFEQMSNWQHPFKKMYLATDLLIACLGAHDGKDGAVMITGTGSCGFSYVDGHPYIVGAHGFPHGDKGSGAWFGLQAAKQSLLSLDGLIPHSSINDKVLALLNVKDDVELVEVIAGKPAAFYALMANLVFDSAEEGDKIALDIVTQGAEYISHVARQLLKQNPPAISLIGGLTPRIKPWLDKDIKRQLIEPKHPPEVGSVIYAKQQLALK